MAAPDVAVRKRQIEDGPEHGSPQVKERRREADDAPPQSAQPDADSRRARNAEALLGRTGGVYIPPAKLAAMRREIKDKASEEYQKLTWEALKKSLNGLINKVNVSNIRNIIAEIFEENLVRGRGLLSRAVMKAQAASPNFTHVYAALIAVINTKLPETGELILKRVITQFKKSYRRNDKTACVASVRFMAHLVNQYVAGDILALQLLTLLLEKPTDDSVEIAVGFVQECGKVRFRWLFVLFLASHSIHPSLSTSPRRLPSPSTRSLTASARCCTRARSTSACSL
jgi:pre-mRNA-splicing factor CWC22